MKIPLRRLARLLSARAQRTVRPTALRLPDGTPAPDPLVLPAHGIVLRAGDLSFALRLAPPAVLAMNKPAGFVCSAVPDGGWPSLFDLVQPACPDPDLRIVGRLDAETTGLLLLTTDGELLHRLTHPRRRVPRTYHAVVARPPERAQVARALEEGIVLRDGDVSAPLAFEPLADAPGTWRIALASGKYHEVRRLVAACGSHVESLRRVSFGPVDVALVPQEGDIVPLPEPLRAALYASVELPLPADELSIEEVGD